MKIYLETERLYLREFTPADEDLLFDLDSDPEVMKYLGGSPTPREKVTELNKRVMAYYPYYKGRFGVWSTHLKSNNEFIGFFILRPPKSEPDNLKMIELGYRIKRKFWRQGFGNEVSKALLERSFKEYGVDTVYAEAHPENVGSIGVMIKVGLKFEKQYCNEELRAWLNTDQVVRYSLKRDEYLKR